MAQLVLGLAGAAIGSAFGMPQVGWAIGSAIGGVVGQKDQQLEGPRLGDLTLQQSSYGSMQPLIYGTWRVSGNVIFSTDLREEATTTTSSGKGGPDVNSTTYSYNVDMAIALSAREIVGIRKIWKEGKLIFDSSVNATAESVYASTVGARSSKLYKGTETQMPDPTIEADLGVGFTPAFRGLSYIVLEGLDCPQGRVPQLSFEVVADGVTSSPVNLFTTIPRTTSNLVAVINQEGVWTLSEADADRSNSLVSYGGPGTSYDIGRVNTVPSGATVNSQVCAVQGGGEPKALCAGFASPSYLDPMIFRLVNMKSLATFDFFSYVPGDSDSSLRPHRAAFDEISGLYCACSATGFYGKIIKILPVNINTPARTTEGGSLAFYNELIYGLDYDGVLFRSLVRVYDGLTGALVRTVDAGADYGLLQLEVSANEHGVYIWEGGVSTGARRVWSISETAWELITGSVSYSSLNGTAGTLYATSDYLLTGHLAASGAYPFSTVRYRALDNNTVPVANVLRDICLRGGVPNDKIDTTAVSSAVYGYAITRVATCRANLEPLLRAFFIDPVESDGFLKFIERSNAVSVASVLYDDLAATEGLDPADPAELERTQEAELPRSVSIAYVDTALDYQMGTQAARRVVTESENDTVIELPVALTSNQAATIAQVLLYDAWNERNKRKLSVPRKYANIDAADVITLEYPRGVYSGFRVSSRLDTGALVELDVVPVDSDLYDVSVVGAAGSGGSQQVDSVEVARLQLLNIPLLREVDNEAGLYAALSGTDDTWTGGILYVGPDAARLSVSGSVTRSAASGFALTVLADWPYEMMDQKNTVDVYTGSFILSNTTRANVLAREANIAILGEEIIGFMTATLISAGVYRLSGLLRGARGTEQARSTHAANERFVVLSAGGILRRVFELSDLGKLYAFKAISYGGNVSKASASLAATTAIALRTFAPINARMTRDDTLNRFTFTWERRTRSLVDFPISGVDVPLFETSEAYVVEIYSSAAYTTLLRTLNATTKTVIYAYTQALIDFPFLPTTFLYIKIKQVTSYGSGLVGTFALAVPPLGEPPFSSVSLLAHFDGADGSTTFTDNSTYVQTLTAVNTITIKTAQSKFGGASLGPLTTGHLRSTSAQYVFGTADFTIEGWLYAVTSTAVAQRGFFQASTNTGDVQSSIGNTIALLAGGGNNWTMYGAGATRTSATPIVTGVWHHFAVVRRNAVTTLYINGNSVLSFADTTDYVGTGLAIGAYFSATFRMDGYIDDFRITKGAARYSANFTAPIAAFPNS